MRDRPIAYEFAEPLPGYRELESVILARKVALHDATAAMWEEQSRLPRRLAIAALAVLIPVFIFSAAAGLGRAERAHQIAGRV